jgi:hypothetical protein
MSEFELMDAARAAKLIGVSEAEILACAAAGKVFLIQSEGDPATSQDAAACPMIGVSEAAERAGLAPQTIRNYADQGKIYCLINPHNQYRSIWRSDAEKLKKRRAPIA